MPSKIEFDRFIHCPILPRHSMAGIELGISDGDLVAYCGHFQQNEKSDQFGKYRFLGPVEVFLINNIVMELTANRGYHGTDITGLGIDTIVSDISHWTYCWNEYAYLFHEMLVVLTDCDDEQMLVTPQTTSSRMRVKSITIRKDI